MTFGGHRYSRECDCGHHIVIDKRFPDDRSAPPVLSVRCAECGSTAACLSASTHQRDSIRNGADCPAIVDDPDETFPQWTRGETT